MKKNCSIGFNCGEYAVEKWMGILFAQNKSWIERKWWNLALSMTKIFVGFNAKYGYNFVRKNVEKLSVS